jgi:hypothetical protein
MTGRQLAQPISGADVEISRGFTQKDVHDCEVIGTQLTSTLYEKNRGSS